MFTQNHNDILEENPSITNHSEAQLPAMKGSRHGHKGRVTKGGHKVGDQEVAELCGLNNHGLGFMEAELGVGEMDENQG